MSPASSDTLAMPERPKGTQTRAEQQLEAHASEGTLNRNSYDVSQSIAITKSSFPFLAAHTMFKTTPLENTCAEAGTARA